MKLYAILLFLALLLLVSLFGGCSGAGAPAATVGGNDLKTIAADSLSAVTLLAGWSSVLYQKMAVDGGTMDLFEELPDGTLHIRGVESDGGAYEWYIYADGSSTGTITWPNGTTFTSAAEPTVWSDDGNSSFERLTNTYPDGARLECTVRAQYSDHTASQWEGMATSPQGRQMTFVLDRIDQERDNLTLRLPDGAVLRWHALLTSIPGAGFWPRFADGATGTYQARGQTLNFRLTGQERWNSYSFTGPDGVTGSFTLGEQMTGDGQLAQDGSTAALLRWTEDGLGTLNLLGTGQQEVTPSAAARDFQISHWLNNIAALGPAPVY